MSREILLHQIETPIGRFRITGIGHGVSEIDRKYQSLRQIWVWSEQDHPAAPTVKMWVRVQQCQNLRAAFDTIDRFVFPEMTDSAGL